MTWVLQRQHFLRSNKRQVSAQCTSGMFSGWINNTRVSFKYPYKNIRKPEQSTSIHQHEKLNSNKQQHDEIINSNQRESCYRLIKCTRLTVFTQEQCFLPRTFIPHLNSSFFLLTETGTLWLLMGMDTFFTTVWTCSTYAHQIHLYFIIVLSHMFKVIPKVEKMLRNKCSLQQFCHILTSVWINAEHVTARCYYITKYTSVSHSSMQIQAT